MVCPGLPITNKVVTLQQAVRNACLFAALSHTNLPLCLAGCFTETFWGFLSVFHKDGPSLQYWGDGEKVFDVTTFDDTARYTAEAALREDITGVLEVTPWACWQRHSCIMKLQGPSAKQSVRHNAMRMPDSSARWATQRCLTCLCSITPAEEGLPADVKFQGGQPSGLLLDRLPSKRPLSLKDVPLFLHLNLKPNCWLRCGPHVRHYLGVALACLPPAGSLSVLCLS